MARCTSLTKRNKRCTRHCVPGTDTCPQHGPKADEVNQGGRPTKLDAKRIAAIADGFRISGTDSGAARAGGVNRNTLREWKSIGKLDMSEGRTTDFTRLVEALEDAKDDLLAELGAQVQAVAIDRGDIPAMFRLMAALEPETWSQTKNIRHGGDPTAPPISVTGPPTTQVLQVTLGADLDAEAAAIVNDEV